MNKGLIRFRFRWSSAIAIILVVAVASFVVGRATKASAAPGVKPGQPVAGPVAQDKPNPLNIQQVDPAPYMAKVRAATNGIAGIDYAKAEAISVLGNDVLIRVPGSDYGGASVRFDVQGNVISTMNIVNQVGDKLVHTKVWMDGKQIADYEIDKAKGIGLSGWVIDRDGIKQDVTGIDPSNPNGSHEISPSFSFRCFNSCMNAQGIPSWLLAGLGILCGFVCAGSAGTLCVPCLQAALIGWGAQVSFCFGFCRDR